MVADESASEVLIIEDDALLARLYAEQLRGAGIPAVAVGTAAAAFERIAATPPALVLLDLSLPDANGLDILADLRRRGGCDVVVVTAHGSVNVAVEAMRAGAHDFLVKPFPPERLVVTVRNALALGTLTRLVDSIGEREAYCGMIGRSLVMQGIYRIIEGAAQSRASVFITGESGTGKELAAEALHARSPRARGPFVALNCAAIPRDLMESEIFGHVRGAFTGAHTDREGAATRAHGGTLFLDEVCEMDLALQSKLLRFLQTGAFQKVGSGVTERVDIRIVSATNRDPLVEVEAGRFREDLYYRLHVVPIHLPPLRQRGDDVRLIARHLLDDLAALEGKGFRRIDAAAEAALAAYRWPGNIRQLYNVLHGAVVLNDGEVLTLDMLPGQLREAEAMSLRPTTTGAPPPELDFEPVADDEMDGIGDPGEPETAAIYGTEGEIRPLWQVERMAIERAIDLCGGNVPRAAALLGISASTIYRKRQAWSETPTDH
ncbi:sigma-54 dependent transcriptional regulator [Tistrella mobilis]|uniref:sigma-54-dependent transcriptional regulator n=1 Tax=Tistrella mobilis TaxID=171437 RepID=UPI0031F661F0